MRVLSFTTLLIEHSFSRHLYNSMEHLTTLLISSDLNLVLEVLQLLYMFSKRSNFLTRLSEDKREVLLERLTYLAEVFSRTAFLSSMITGAYLCFKWNVIHAFTELGRKRSRFRTCCVLPKFTYHGELNECVMKHLMFQLLGWKVDKFSLPFCDCICRLTRKLLQAFTWSTWKRGKTMK